MFLHILARWLHSIMNFLCGREKPHLQHFATKWNKFSFHKPAGPLAGGLSAANEMRCLGAPVKPVSLSLSLVFRCVLQHPFYLSPFPNSFRAENEFLSSHAEHRDYRKLQMLKCVTEGSCVIWIADSLSPPWACHLHACAAGTRGSGTEGRLQWHRAVLTAALWSITLLI